MDDLRAAVRRYWPVLLATPVLWFHARVFDFVNDDAYISFRYAKNLAEHGQLVFNLAERVEGYTNFLWTVLLALGIKLGVAPTTAARFLGVALAVGTLAAVVRLSLRLDGERSHPAHAVAPLGLAATSAFACWATGGLESQLFTFLTVLAVDRLLDESERGAGVASAVFFGLAALTRPEGTFFFAVAGLWRLLVNLARERRLRPRRAELLWIGAFLAVFLPYFLWRWHYYGWLFPNTFYVKSSGGGTGTLRNGLYYLRKLVEEHEPILTGLLLAAGLPARADRRRGALFGFALLFAGAYLAYVVKVGGDFMGLYRFVLPLFPLTWLCLQEASRTLYARLAPVTGRPALALAGATVAAAFVVGAVHLTRENVTFIGADNGIDTPGYLRQYALDRIPVGRWFGRYAKPDDFMSVGGAGVIPFESGIRAFDSFGLVDEHIAHDKSMTTGDRPGHKKWAPDSYVVSRKPTLITHIYHLRERYQPSPGEAAYWRNYGYEWVTADIPELSPPFYSFLKRIDRAFGPLPAHGAAPKAAARSP